MKRFLGVVLSALMCANAAAYEEISTYVYDGTISQDKNGLVTGKVVGDNGEVFDFELSTTTGQVLYWSSASGLFDTTVPVSSDLTDLYAVKSVNDAKWAHWGVVLGGLMMCYGNQQLTLHRAHKYCGSMGMHTNMRSTGVCGALASYTCETWPIIVSPE